MKIRAMLLSATLALAGCQTTEKPAVKSALPPVAADPAPVGASELDPNNIEKVRVGESLKAYPSGRYVDPNNPGVMHEAHTIYRRESGPNWNMNPNAPTVVPLGPVLAVADAAKTPNPLPAELEQKIAEQNQLMATLIEQNEGLASELGKLSKEIVELRGKPTSGNGETKKGSSGFLVAGEGCLGRGWRWTIR